MELGEKGCHFKGRSSSGAMDILSLLNHSYTVIQGISLYCSLSLPLSLSLSLSLFLQICQISRSLAKGSKGSPIAPPSISWLSGIHSSLAALQPSQNIQDSMKVFTLGTKGVIEIAGGSLYRPKMYIKNFHVKNFPSPRFPHVRFAQFHHPQVHFKCISCGFRVGKCKCFCAAGTKWCGNLVVFLEKMMFSPVFSSNFDRELCEN